MAKVTVLVAVWNAENYLAESLDSLLAQTHADLQIICIDDASTDRSPQILADYALRDSRVEVVTLTENGGQAHARNIGLQRATGQYVAFVDSDDWLAPDAISQVVATFQQHPQTDSVLFHLLSVFEDGHEEEYQSPYPHRFGLTGREAFEQSLTWQIHGVYVVRGDIHRRFPYDETCRAYSDDNTTRLHYLNSREVRGCDGTYYYRQHSGSTTHQVTLRHFDYLKANESMKRQLIDLHVDEHLLDLYENVRWLVVIDSYWFYFKHRSTQAEGNAVCLSVTDSRAALSEMRRVWQTIELSRLTCRNKRKFGYIPFRCCWHLFVLQEEIYFTLRKLLGR